MSGKLMAIKLLRASVSTLGLKEAKAILDPVFKEIDDKAERHSKRRFEAAKAAMTGLAAHGANDLEGAALVAVDAVHLADALLAALNDGNESS